MPIATPALSFERLTGLRPDLNLVDIGANFIGEPPPYQPLLDRDVVSLVAFEPQDEARLRLQGQIPGKVTLLPHAVGDGNRHELRVCQMSGMSSLFEPDQHRLRYWHLHAPWAEVQERLPMETVRLDDVREISRMDYLKIDVQAAELMIFQHGTERLKDCVVLHTEAFFVPMYEGQPLFSELELFLRSQGFMLHRLEPVISYLVSPLIINGNAHDGISQVSWADCVFVKDYTRAERLTPDQVIRMAALLHDLYRAYDVVLRILLELDAREGTQHGSRYFQGLQKVPMPPTRNVPAAR